MDSGSLKEEGAGESWKMRGLTSASWVMGKKKLGAHFLDLGGSRRWVPGLLNPKGRRGQGPRLSSLRQWGSEGQHSWVSEGKGL